MCVGQPGRPQCRGGEGFWGRARATLRLYLPIERFHGSLCAPSIQSQPALDIGALLDIFANPVSFSPPTNTDTAPHPLFSGRSRRSIVRPGCGSRGAPLGEDRRGRAFLFLDGRGGVGFKSGVASR